MAASPGGEDRLANVERLRSLPKLPQTRDEVVALGLALLDREDVKSEWLKHIGATVITTASAANHDYVRSLGADQVIVVTGLPERGSIVWE